MVISFHIEQNEQPFDGTRLGYNFSQTFAYLTPKFKSKISKVRISE